MGIVNIQIDEFLFVELGKLYNEKVLSEQYKFFTSELVSNTLYINNNARKNLLATLCDKYGSDKGSLSPDSTDKPYGWKAHTYTDFYSLIFDHCRNSFKRVFECGIGTSNIHIPNNMSENGKPGASLRVWRDYFPNAEIFAGDIDRDILFTEDRIKCFWLDQLNPNSILEFWNSVGGSTFDLMIDDGLHKYEAGVTLFENSIHMLSSNGTYIIEDVTVTDLPLYKSYFSNLPYAVSYLAAQRSGELVSSVQDWISLEDNNLIIIKRY